ncbi:hypothetical protein F5Y11DRAFT_98909 [Daldinia sp. FL1419]|nr:hypothetical protein F5Y11DRAFT_98909 [Daldinia sp. FL1419]
MTTLPICELGHEPTEELDPNQKIEDHPSGYPRFAALTGSHASFFAFRRFAALRARMILNKQDCISQLEIELHNIDRDEEKPFYRCCSRSDANQKRKEILQQLDVVMAQYDDLSQRTRQVLAAKPASPRDVKNLSQWVKGFGCIVAQETAYLTHKRDLMALGPAETDDFVTAVTHKVEDFIIWTSGILGCNLRDPCSYDPGVHIFSDCLIKTASRSILAVFASVLLLVPIVVLTLVETVAVRLTVVLLSDAIFVFVVSVLAETKMGEIFMAGAGYAAVMIVYISGTN